MPRVRTHNSAHVPFFAQAKLEKEKAKKMKVKAERDARKEKDKQKWRDRKAAWKLKRKAEKEAKEKRKAAEAEAKKAQAEKLLRDRARSLTGGEDSDDDDDDSDGDRCSSLLCLLCPVCVFVLGVSDTIPHVHDRTPNFVIFTLSPKRTHFIVCFLFSCLDSLNVAATTRPPPKCRWKQSRPRKKKKRWKKQPRAISSATFASCARLASRRQRIEIFGFCCNGCRIFLKRPDQDEFFFVVQCLPSCESLALVFSSIVSIRYVGGLLGLRRSIREANVVSKA